MNDTERDMVMQSFRAMAMAITAALSLPLALATNARAKEQKPMVMFVQIADDLKVDPTAQTLRLVHVGQQTIYFADRPERIAGHMKMVDYLNEWTSKAGSDNFRNNPPNATVSVFEPGKASDTLAVVTISNPKTEGADLIYNYRVIGGALPAAGGATSLFIDWIGLGRGNGSGLIPWD